MRPLKILAYFILFQSCFGCKSDSKNTNARSAAYYWKTQFRWSESESELCENLNIDRLYIRYFDVKVELNGEVLPNALIDLEVKDLPLGIDAVPVVFILNAVFTKIKKPEGLKELAQKTAKLVMEIHEGQVLKELQIDCDWSESTASTYFEFLKILKAEVNCPLSATLRLWQFKDRKTAGVPPVDRVMLMVYNLQNPSDWGVENSILEVSEAKKYVQNQLKYPLQMDIALPIFSWAVHFRAKECVGFVRDLEAHALEKLDFMEKISQNRFRCTKDTTWRHYHFLKNDALRLEEVSPEARTEIIQLTTPYVAQQDSFYLTIFSFDQAFLADFEGF